ncbi:MAG: isoprenylcysteine carboxylmethyltransferase family protein [Methanothrix sp.]|nr:isoprenylcysteine carboxylmethyltransferase family protein [Methanothrix sp.]
MISGVVAMTAYFAFFAVMHSILADPRFKSRARKELGEAFDRWQRLVYTVLALIMILPFFYIFVHFPDRILYIIPWPGSGLMAAGQALAAIALLVALRQTGISYFLGLEQLKGTSAAGGLVTSGFYCHLRNPLFFFAALFLWLSPIMTVNLLAFNILSTIYFYIGALHEERSLREEFGQEYEGYRQRVPMFLPRLKCRADSR